MKLYAISMGNMFIKLFIWNILWLISIYSIVCESAYKNTSEETTTISITNIRNSRKFSNITIILCHCNSGEVMDLTGQCQPYKKGNVVPTLSHPESGQQLIDTKEFNVVVQKPQCVNPQVHLNEDQFILSGVEGVTELQVTEGSYRGLIVADYCVHHQWNQGKVKVTAQGCVAVPVIPRCCHMDNGDCINETNTPFSFNPPLVTGMPQSDQGLAGPLFPWESLQDHVDKPSCEPGEILKKIELDGRKAYLATMPNRVLLTWHPTGSQRQYSNHKNYCVDLINDENKYYAYICQVNLDVFCTNTMCQHKCCSDGEALSMESMTCISNDLPFTIPFPSPPNSMETFYRKPTCTNGFPEETLTTDITDSKLIRNGSLIHKNITYPSVMFCMDNFINGNSTEFGFLVCKKELPWRNIDIFHYHTIPPFLGLSCGFLALLLLLHAWIPKLREKEGMYQLFHASSLLSAFSIQLMQIFLTHQGFVFSGFCAPLAFASQFSYLSAFFWLNTMCFDVWRLFRKLVRNPYSPISSVALWKYMMYAVGGPFTIFLVTSTVQYVAPGDGSISGLIHPHIGEDVCWFKGLWEAVPYFYVPMSMLCVLNLIFIGNTYHCLKIIQRDLTCDIETSGDIKTRQTDCVAVFWQQFYLLSLTAGLWLTEVLSYFIPPQEIWMLTDAMNMLQGVFIFFVFLCNEKKRGYLKEQLPKLLEFTNMWIGEADAAQVDISNHNPGLSKKKSPLNFMAHIFSTTSFNLNTNATNTNTTINGITPLSIAQTVANPLDPHILPCTYMSKLPHEKI